MKSKKNLKKDRTEKVREKNASQDDANMSQPSKKINNEKRPSSAATIYNNNKIQPRIIGFLKQTDKSREFDYKARKHSSQSEVNKNYKNKRKSQISNNPLKPKDH